MSDPVALLREKEAKLETRVAKDRARLTANEAELQEVRTAIKVLARMGLVPDDDGSEPSTGKEAMNEDQRLVVSFVPFGEEFAIAPKHVHTLVESMNPDITGDYVRTTLWRMARRGVLKSRNGLYWHPGDPEAENVAASDVDASEADNGTVGPHGGGTGFPSSTPEGSIPSGSTRPRPASFDVDLDDDDPPSW